MSRDYLIRLRDMLASATRARAYATGIPDAATLASNQQILDAVMFNRVATELPGLIERLREIIAELAVEVRPARSVAGRDLDQILTAVDGSVVQTLSTIAQAAYLKNVHGESQSAWRLHTHFDVDRHGGYALTVCILAMRRRND